jgi:hypothetical protein
MFTVYVLQSIKMKRYIGHTFDLERRLLEHNSGLCKSTKIDRDWRVIYLLCQVFRPYNSSEVSPDRTKKVDKTLVSIFLLVSSLKLRIESQGYSR